MSVRLNINPEYPKLLWDKDRDNGGNPWASGSLSVPGISSAKALAVITGGGGYTGFVRGSIYHMERTFYDNTNFYTEYFQGSVSNDVMGYPTTRSQIAHLSNGGHSGMGSPAIGVWRIIALA
jgi:hypothetical protein